MKRFATTLCIFLAAIALGSAPAMAVQQIPESVAEFAGELRVDYLTQRTTTGPASAQFSSIVYDNTTSPVNFGFSSTDLTAIFGDQVFTTGTGTLSQFTFSVFNSPSSAGALLTAGYLIQLYDGSSLAPLGSFTTNVSYGAGLAPGFYSLVNVTSLDPLNIVLNTTNVIVLQHRTAQTGTASRMGIASFDPPAVGSSPATMYIAALTVGGGAGGFYTIATGPANPGYKITVADSPVPTRNSSWGRIKSLYR